MIQQYILNMIKNGVIIPNENMTKDFINDILGYFKDINDDEYYELIKNKSI